MVWDMGSYERYCAGCIGWIWAGGFEMLLVDFVLRLVGDLCDFVWFCICELNDVLYDFIGWFLIHRGKFWDVGREKSNCGRLHLSKMTKSHKYPV